MSRFCGRRTVIDPNGECHDITGLTVHEINYLINGNTNTNNLFGEGKTKNRPTKKKTIDPNKRKTR